MAQWSLESTDGVKLTKDYPFTLDKDSQQLAYPDLLSRYGQHHAEDPFPGAGGDFLPGRPVPCVLVVLLAVTGHVPCILLRKSILSSRERRLPS